jgi:hypothetical protein
MKMAVNDRVSQIEYQGISQGGRKGLGGKKFPENDFLVFNEFVKLLAEKVYGTTSEVK